MQQPLSGDLYAGTGPVDVFKSSDGGETWQECEQIRTLPESKLWTFPGPPHMGHVKGLAASPHDPNTVYGSVEEGWVIRTTDGGATWATLKEGVEFDNHSVAVMPDDANVVLSTSGTGVYRSIDGGESFAEANDGLDRRYMAQIVVHPDRPRTLFTAAAEVPPPFWRRPQGAAAAIYRSDDQGQSWRRCAGGGLPEQIAAGPRCVAGDPADAATFFVGFSDGAIWASRDGGERFARVLEGLPHVTSIRVAHD